MRWREKDGVLEFNSGGGWNDAGLDDVENLRWIAERLNKVFEVDEQ